MIITFELKCLIDKYPNINSSTISYHFYSYIPSLAVCSLRIKSLVRTILDRT